MALPPGAALGLKIIFLLGFLALIGWGIYEGYKAYQDECPDGLFVCLGIDDPEGGGAGPGTGPGAAASTRTTTPPADQSPNFAKCTRYFNEDDKQKTCYDAAAGTGGVGWFWSNTRGGVDCKKLVKSYKIDVTSAMDSHTVTRTHTLDKKGANGIIFNNAKLWTIGSDGTKYNMLLNVTPYDENGKILADPLMGEELNPITTGKSCAGIGVTPIDFMKSFTFPAADSSPPPPPPPVDCEGSYEPTGSCVSGPYCGDMGTVTQTFNVTKQPQHGGGSCPTASKSVPCTKSEPCQQHPSPPEERPSCMYGNWQNELTAGYLGQGLTRLYPDNDPRDGTAKSGTDLNVCTKPYRDGPTDPPGKRLQFRPITNVNFVRGMDTIGCVPITSDAEGTDDAYATERMFDCNENTYKPIDCAGDWTPSDPKTEYKTQSFSTPGGTKTQSKKKVSTMKKWVATPGLERGKHGGKDDCPAHLEESVVKEGTWKDA